MEGIEAIVDFALDAASAVVGTAEAVVDVASQTLKFCQYPFAVFIRYYFLTYLRHGLDSFIDLAVNNFGGVLDKVANIKRFHAAVNITKSGITEALFDVTVVGQEIKGSFQTELKWSSIVAQLLPLLTQPISDLFNAIKDLRDPVSKRI